MQNGTSASEDSLAVSYKIKYTLILEPSNCSRWHLSQLVETLCPHKNLLMNAYRSIISNYQNLEITNISFSQSVSQFSHSVVSNSLRPHEPQHTRLPVHHQLPESTPTHVHWVCDAIQPSHPLLSPSPPAPNPSQDQDLFQWVNSLHEVAKVLEFQLQHQSFQCLSVGEWISKLWNISYV